MIKAENLVKHFGPIVAVDHISFEVNRGDILGFLGPNGAGKSTTMQMLTGFLPMDNGSVQIGEYNMETNPLAAKALIGYLPENAPMYPDMSAIGFLKFCAEVHGFSGKDKKSAIDRVIELCTLQGVKYQSIDTLSKGFKRRVCLAQALLHKPSILIMDEPTDGLDPNQKFEVRKLISEISAETAIVLSTHILEEVESVCNRTILIKKGQLVFNGTPGELRAKSKSTGAIRLVAQKPFKELKEVFSSCETIEKIEKLDDKDGIVTIRLYPAKPENIADCVNTVIRLLAEKDITVSDIGTEQGELDEVFRNMTASIETVQNHTKAGV